LWAFTYNALHCAAKDSTTMNATEFVKSKYLKASDLATGKAAKLRVADVTEDELGPEREKKLCLHFATLPQALALNRTQTKRMIDLFGPSTDSWINQTVILSVIPTMFQGRQVATFAIDSATSQAKTGDNPFASREYSDAEAPVPF